MTSPTVDNLRKAVSATIDAHTRARDGVSVLAANLASVRDAGTATAPPTGQDRAHVD
jgi:hypothetical protein